MYAHTVHLLAAAVLTTKIVFAHSLSFFGVGLFLFLFFFPSHASLNKVTNARKKNREYLVDV